MRMMDLIEKKRDGFHHTKEEIEFIITGFTKGEIPDYQMSAWAMAVYFQGMSAEETAYLTQAMCESGEQIDLSSIKGIKVDKHSTGGVGDTTTLVLAPLVASCGIPVAKMSGRGLGHTGGTIDKLESFPGFQVEIPKERFVQLVNQHGLAVMGQSANLTPADKQLYALRDVTATVNSIPLIASSIMSKKIAAGSDKICLDVKVGRGAFMKSVDEARQLARAMVAIGNHLGKETLAIISDMNQPLGQAVGNILEVKEALATLKGEGPEDLTQLCLTLGTHMLLLAGKTGDELEARSLLQSKLDSGEALNKFAQFVEAQGGDAQYVFQPERFPQASYQVEVLAQESGYIAQLDALEIGKVAMILGAGRVTKDTAIDLTVGLVLHKKIGDRVEKGEVLATLHMNEASNKEAEERVGKAFAITKDAPANIPPLIYEVIRG